MCETPLRAPWLLRERAGGAPGATAAPLPPKGGPGKADAAAACGGSRATAGGWDPEPAAPGGPLLEQPAPEGLHPPRGTGACWRRSG